MKYVIYELVSIPKNKYEDYVFALEGVWPDESAFNNKIDAVEKIKELKKVKTSFERNFTILEVW